MSLLKEKRESLMGLPILSISGSLSIKKNREITADYKLTRMIEPLGKVLSSPL